MIKHYIKIAFRNLWKIKARSFVSIGGLTLGFLAFLVGFYWIYYELNYDRFYKESDRIFRVNINMGQGDIWLGIPYPLKDKLKNTFPEIEFIDIISTPEHLTNQGITIKAEENQERVTVPGIVYREDFLKIFPQTTLNGKEYSGSNDGALLTESLAKRLYGTTNIEGKLIHIYWEHAKYRMDQPIKIAGIIKDPPFNTVLKFDILIPHEVPVNDEWSNYSYPAYIKLHNKADKEQFLKKIKEFKFRNEHTPYLVPLSDVKHRNKGESFIEAYGILLIVAMATLLLLLSALFNYIILYITDILGRTKEMALRQTLGADFKNTRNLFYTEIIISFLIILILSLLLLPVLKNFLFLFTGVPMHGFHFYLIFFALWIICLLVILLFSSYPLWKIYKSNLYNKIRQNKNYLRKITLTIQLIICIFFLFCLLQFIRQFLFMNKSDFGFEKENILKLELPAQYKDKSAPFLNYIKSNPYVENVIHMNFEFYHTSFHSYTDADDIFKTDKKEAIYVSPLPPGFASFFHLTLNRGRFFNQEEDNEGFTKAVVNETLVHYLGIENIIGEKIYFRQRYIEIIGVVKDFHTAPMTTKIYPHIFINERQSSNLWGSGSIFYYIKYTSGKEKEVRRTLQEAYSSIIPEEEIKINSFSDYVRSFYLSESKIIQIFGFIAGSCLLISLLGIYAMVSLSARQRRKEIAIRKINGAPLSNLNMMIIKEYIMMVLVASLVGLPPGYILINKWLQTFYAFSIQARMEGILIALLVLLLVVFIVLQKIIKVIHENPAEVLKSE